MIETSPSFINDLLFLFLPKVCLLESQLDGNLIASAFWQTGVRTYESTLMRKEDIHGFTDVTSYVGWADAHPIFWETIKVCI